MRLSVSAITSGFLSLALLFLGLTPLNAAAEFATGASMSSTNFHLLDSQHGSFGAVSSSSSGSFILLGNIGDIAIGSSSISDFKLNSGFLYYPKVTAPSLDTATAGDSQVALTWSPATAFQGLSVGAYDVCFKSTGAYSCTNVGSVVSYTKTGLTNSTAYTFEIQAEDSLGNIIAISNEKSVTPVSSGNNNNNSSGGGGGSGSGYAPVPTGPNGWIIVNGTAYPNALISVFVDGILALTARAGDNAEFQATLNNVSVGTHALSLASQDSNGRKSITTNFSVNVMANATVVFSNVLLPPTISINATRLQRGDTLRVFGQAEPSSSVDVHIFSKEVVNNVVSDSTGAYELDFNTKPLDESSHTTKSRAMLTSLLSPFSETLQFVLGQGGIKTGQGMTADLNGDNKVSITDFSILLYWWNTGSSTGLQKVDLNHDGKVNIVDFSILLFQWTN